MLKMRIRFGGLRYLTIFVETKKQIIMNENMEENENTLWYWLKHPTPLSSNATDTLFHIGCFVGVITACAIIIVTMLQTLFN